MFCSAVQPPSREVVRGMQRTFDRVDAAGGFKGVVHLQTVLDALKTGLYQPFVQAFEQYVLCNAMQWQRLAVASFGAVLCCAMAVLCCAVLCCAVLCCAVLCCAAVLCCCAVLCYAVAVAWLWL